MTETLLHIYPTFAVGGAQARFAAIANHFGRRWRHVIVSLDGNTACRERLDPGLDVSFLPVDVRKGDTLGNVRRFRAVLRAVRPKTLMTANWGSIEWTMANKLVGLPHVHVEDGFGPEEREIQLPRRVLTRRLLLRRCTTVLPSRTLYRIATDTWRLKPGRVRYIPNGVDLRLFATSPGRNTETPVIGTVAALRPEKNIARLVRAFALAADCPGRLMIVGDGAERPALEALVREHGLVDRVEFTGHVSEPARIYGAFDLFALSSDTEQMPLSVLEAMASGLPIASTNVGDVAAMLPAESQPYIVSRNDVALADALRALLTDPAIRTKAGVANRAKAVREYDQARMFQAYAELFDGTAGLPTALVDIDRPLGLSAPYP